MVERGDPTAGRLTDAVVHDLVPQLRQFLRARYRLVSDHDDLVQQALSDLHQYLSEGAFSAKSSQDLTALAFTILKRRIADRFRSEAKHFALSSTTHVHSQEPLAPSAETVVSYRELLATVIGFIAEMEESDRSLLLNEAAGPERTAPMPPAERQRLSRLRAQLRNLLQQRGVSPQDMKEDSDG